MEATFETVEPCEVVVTVSVSAGEFQSEYDSSVQRLGQNVRMKGFRPGKIPRRVLEKHHGEELKRETQQQFVQRGLQQAVQEGELQPVGNPRLKAEDLVDDGEGGFTAKIGLSLRPTIELGDYKGLAVEAPAIAVSDAEVEQALEGLRNQTARPEPLGDDGLPEDGIALCKVKITAGEETLLEQEGMRMTPLHAPPGLDPETWKATLGGKRPGDAFDVEMTFPADFEREDLQGAPGSCSVQVDQAFAMVKPSDEELWKMAGVEDQDGLLGRIREDLERAKTQQRDQQVEVQLLDQVVRAHAIELPGRMVTDQVAGRIHQTRQELLQQGISEADAEAQVTEQEEQFRAEAEHNTSALFLLEEIAKAEGLGVKNEDIAAKFKEIAQRNRTSVEEVQKYYQEQNLVGQLAMEVLELKVRAFLREHATITETASA